ncbi:Bug family tripartite tricarboxylate transporter substrate binding protein [Rhodoplanes sp. Z2-YC6860]|uniref:Bug family tripartite tricarboxylate transporter substrate binding protein n=1 Tax=Rhodoplanes sp. Z2-YC6860 TaxID=674703 RepID=UPI00078CD7C5|nr:tripartite tricarboxylate transporter substrate binding protein [Rhodoplanes sp. Z2-YC6860]AMN40100.1 TTT family tricarboxylate transporter, receptor protein [Rhodoplanes sp. Z2-YC6860]
MRVVFAALAAALTFFSATVLPSRSASALDYPNRPVRVIIPFTAGGAPDVLMRMVGQALSEKWGQGVVIENRAGGNTMVGTVAAAKSPADGYTLLLAADQTFVLNPLLYATLPYSMKELDTIALIASIPHMLAVANKVPVSNVKELIALAKAKPDTITFGTTGAGTIQRIATEYFAAIAGVKLVHVPYKGANEATMAILQGEIDMTINGMSNILPHIESHKLKALAVSTAERNPLVPDIPTMQEAGVPGYTSQGSFGLFAPAGTPHDIRDKIAADVAEIIARPDVKKALEARSFVVTSLGPDAFDKYIASEHVKWEAVIKRAGIKGD